MILPTFLPLAAALIYAAGALLVKRSAELGVGVWRTAFVANVSGAVLFLPLLAFGGTFHVDLWWQPLAVGACYTLGQWLTFRALDQGDVSVATPMLGTKILFVAVILTVVGHQDVTWPLWLAALLAVLGITLLSQRGRGTSHPHVRHTILHAGLAAAIFAVFDVLIQTWAPRWGIGRFLPLTMLSAAVFSFGFVPMFRAPLRAIPPSARGWLIAGTATMALQSILFVSTVAQWGNAPRANIVYSSRGLWSVVLVSLCGHWVKSQEQQLAPATLRFRLAGATLMMAAITLAVGV